MTETEINQLQLLQQNLQNILLQKQQLQRQSAEIQSALKELENAPAAYRILGNVMVSADKELLSKELKEKTEVTGLRMKNFEKQEETIKKKAEELQKKILEELKDGKRKDQQDN